MSVPDFPPGKVLGGKYVLGPLLQKSPWASTYRAQVSGQDVVVKVLDTDLAARQPVLDAILRAGAATATVPEPFVVPILEHGKDPETGALFIVTRMSANAPLSTLISRGPSPAEAVVAMMRSIGQALDAAHGVRLAHLALKPSNIFVGPAPAPPGGNPQAPAYAAQVGDFGANAIRALAPDQARQSFAAPWLAPEQIANDDVAGPSSDVFAAALIAFAALTGTSFWRSCATPAPDPAAWRAEVIGAPPRASQRAAEVGVTLSPAFDAVFARALTVPHSRFASVGELAKALEGALDASRAAAPAAPPPANQYAATVPLTGPLGPPMAQGAPAAQGVSPGQSLGPFGGPPQPGAGVSGAPPNEAVQAVAAPTEPKKGGKAWIFAVLALVLVIGGVVGLVLYQRARANASMAMAAASAQAAAASASAAAAAASASAAAAMASAQAAVNAAEPAASGEAPAGSGEAPAPSAAPAASGGAPEPEATGSAVAVAPPPSPPDTGAAVAPPPPPAPAPDEPRPRPHREPTNPPPAAGGENPRPAGNSGAPKKPCGKFLERCPDSGS